MKFWPWFLSPLYGKSELKHPILFLLCAVFAWLNLTFFFQDTDRLGSLVVGLVNAVFAGVLWGQRK